MSTEPKLAAAADELVTEIKLAIVVGTIARAGSLRLALQALDAAICLRQEPTDQLARMRGEAALRLILEAYRHEARAILKDPSS